MTGDRVRGTKFPLRFLGYDTYQVDACMRAIAEMLDAGQSATFYISHVSQHGFRSALADGCHQDAVDDFLDALAEGRTPEYRQPMSYGDHWPAGHSGGRYRYRHINCRAEWRGLPELPGTRLRWKQGLAGTRPRIVASDGQTLVDRRLTRAFTSLALASGETFRVLQGREVVNAGTGDPVLRFTGPGYCWGGTVMLPSGQRWLMFPMRGTGHFRGTVMSAVDDSGAEKARFRLTRTGVVDIAVSPHCPITPEILCVAATAAPPLAAEFHQH